MTERDLEFVAAVLLCELPFQVRTPLYPEWSDAFVSVPGDGSFRVFATRPVCRGVVTIDLGKPFPDYFGKIEWRLT